MLAWYIGQGCEYDLGELGFEQVGVDGCELGRHGRKFKYFVV